MKGHVSHDVLLLCPRCHQISNMHDYQLRETLSIECNAPFPAKNINTKTIEVPRLKYVLRFCLFFVFTCTTFNFPFFRRELKSICRALYFKGDKIPEERQNQLRAQLKELCPEEENFSDEFLKTYIDIETT